MEISILGLRCYPMHSTRHRSNATSPLAHYPISASRTWILSFWHRLSHPVFTCKTHQRLPDQFIKNAIRPTFTLASQHTLPTSRIYLQLAATFASHCCQPFYHLFINYCTVITWLPPLDLPPQFLLVQKPIFLIPIRKRLQKHLQDVTMKLNLFSGNLRKWRTFTMFLQPNVSIWLPTTFLAEFLKLLKGSPSTIPRIGRPSSLKWRS